MKIQFSEQELSGSRFMGEGNFIVSVFNIVHGQSKAGNDMVTVEFKHGEKTVKEYFPLGGNKFKLAALALALGFTPQQLQSGEFDTSMMQGKALVLHRKVTGKEVWEGKERNVYGNEFSKLTGEAVVAASKDQDEIPF